MGDDSSTLTDSILHRLLLCFSTDKIFLSFTDRHVYRSAVTSAMTYLLRREMIAKLNK